MHYTLKDRGYFDALKVFTDEFERQGAKYALVGGAGIQARVSDILCRALKTGISSTTGLEHLLRETKDFDITTNSPEAFFVTYFNEMQALHPHVSIQSESVRSKRMKLKGKEDTSVFFNYQTGPQDLSGLDEDFYNECIETAQPINLRYNGSNLCVFVATPECLITSKLTRNDPKDIWDIATLMRVMKAHKQHSGKLRDSKIKRYLERANKGEMFGRFQEIKKQILKE